MNYFKLNNFHKYSFLITIKIISLRTKCISLYKANLHYDWSMVDAWMTYIDMGFFN